MDWNKLRVVKTFGQSFIQSCPSFLSCTRVIGHAPGSRSRQKRALLCFCDKVLTWWTTVVSDLQVRRFCRIWTESAHPDSDWIEGSRPWEGFGSKNGCEDLWRAWKNPAYFCVCATCADCAAGFSGGPGSKIPTLLLLVLLKKKKKKSGFCRSSAPDMNDVDAFFSSALFHCSSVSEVCEGME